MPADTPVQDISPRALKRVFLARRPGGSPLIAKSAEQHLTGLGYDVVNAYDVNAGGEMPFVEAAREETRLMTRCDAVVLLPGDSLDELRCAFQVQLALSLGMRVLQMQFASLVTETPPPDFWAHASARTAIGPMDC